MDGEAVREDEVGGGRGDEGVWVDGGVGRERWRCVCDRRVRMKKSAGDLRRTLRVEVEDGRVMVAHRKAEAALSYPMITHGLPIDTPPRWAACLLAEGREVSLHGGAASSARASPGTQSK
jgi:hypothetical protein